MTNNTRLELPTNDAWCFSAEPLVLLQSPVVAVYKPEPSSHFRTDSPQPDFQTGTTSFIEKVGLVVFVFVFIGRVIF
jgi:hypothetical protein